MLYFDVTLMVGQNSTLEYDRSGGIIEKELSLNKLSVQISEEKVGKFTILKDPILNHVNIYAIEFYDLPIEIINMFKNNLVTSIVVRIGDSLAEGQKNFNLFKIFIRPITIYEHPLQEDKVLNDLIIKGISLTANAVVLDSTFGSELEIIDTTSVSTNVKTNKSKSTPSYKSYTPMDPSLTLGTRHFDPNNKSIHANIRAKNPGNIRHRENSLWPGQIGYIETIHGKFAKFDSYENGAAAGLSNLRNYMQTYNKYTIRDIVSRWAPPSENDTEGYIAYVSKKLGINPNQRLKESDLAPLFKIMAIKEGDNKGIYTDEIINRGAQIIGIDSMVKSGYNYGNNENSNINNGTNVNKLVNIYSNITGFTLLGTFLQKLKEKYGIETDVRSMANNIKSNFLYKNISMPAAPTLELLKKVHEFYPPYMANIPWILDDAKPITDINFLGKTFYAEINILAIESLDFKSLKYAFGSNTTLSTTRLNIENFKQFYGETLDRIEAKNIIFKNLNSNQETTFPGKPSNEVAVIPDVGSSTSNSEGMKQIKISSSETIKVEAMYDAVEFGKRYQIFKNHVKTSPQIVRCKIQSDNPIFIDFGNAYTFSEQQLNKVTPYKIKMEFRNINNQFQLSHEVDFYKGISVVQA